MRKRRFGLRAQFILLIIIGLGAIFITITLVVVRVTTNNLRENLVIQSKSFAALATKPIGDTFVTYKDSGTIRIVQQVNKFTDLNATISNVVVVDLSGKAVYQQHEGASLGINKTEAATFEPVYTYKNGIISRITTPYFDDFGAHQYSLVYLVSPESVQRSISTLRSSLIWIALAALVVSILVAYLVISQSFLKPIRQVSSGALDISKGNLSFKIEPKRHDEIGDLATSVNSMADALKADIRKLKETDTIKTEFMMIASHNLRTPLTIMQGYLDMLLMSKELTPDVRNSVEIVAASGSRLAVFAEDILTVSRIETGEDVMHQREKVDLVKLLEGLAKDFKPLAREKNLEVVAQLAGGPCMANISTPHFRASIWNLLDNALKFTEKGSISLSLQQSGGQALITVRDTGAGIAPEEVPKLFTKFHRGTSTMEYNYEGSGIGLYLTKLIIGQHGGTIVVDSKLGAGTVVSIRIPLAQAQPNA
jgi:signal transduction histidine kinase